MQQNNAIEGVKNLKSYIIGFILSLLLTIMAFSVAAFPVFKGKVMYMALTIFALSQLMVQVVCFLRLNTKTTQDQWNLLAFIFTLIVVLILVSGSLWIMYNMNYNMM